MSAPSAPPDAAALHQAALTYLARYAATEAGLRRTLLRRIDRWARAHPDPDMAEEAVAIAQAAVETVVTALVRAGAINDAAFAENRARSLSHGGRSRAAIRMRLVAKGVAPELAQRAAGDDPAVELGAALVLTRRRRIGPFRSATAADRQKELAVLARAGFSREIADTALTMERAEAERRILALRSDQLP